MSLLKLENQVFYCKSLVRQRHPRLRRKARAASAGQRPDGAFSSLPWTKRNVKQKTPSLLVNSIRFSVSHQPADLKGDCLPLMHRGTEAAGHVADAEVICPLPG